MLGWDEVHAQTFIAVKRIENVHLALIDQHL